MNQKGEKREHYLYAMPPPLLQTLVVPCLRYEPLEFTECVCDPDPERRKRRPDGDERDEEVVVVGHEDGRDVEDDVDDVGQVEHGASTPSEKSRVQIPVPTSFSIKIFGTDYLFYLKL